MCDDPFSSVRSKIREDVRRTHEHMLDDVFAMVATFVETRDLFNTMALVSKGWYAMVWRSLLVLPSLVAARHSIPEELLFRYHSVILRLSIEQPWIGLIAARVPRFRMLRQLRIPAIHHGDSGRYRLRSLVRCEVYHCRDMSIHEMRSACRQFGDGLHTLCFGQVTGTQLSNAVCVRTYPSVTRLILRHVTKWSYADLSLVLKCFPSLKKLALVSCCRFSDPPPDHLPRSKTLSTLQLTDTLLTFTGLALLICIGTLKRLVTDSNHTLTPSIICATVFAHSPLLRLKSFDACANRLTFVRPSKSRL